MLVVEDETLTRLMLGAELEACGYRVIEAANADEALLILRGNPSVKLLFTDVNMPGVLDGLALAQLARAEHPGVKVIIASGHMRLSEWPSMQMPCSQSLMTSCNSSPGSITC